MTVIRTYYCACLATFDSEEARAEHIETMDDQDTLQEHRDIGHIFTTVPDDE